MEDPAEIEGGQRIYTEPPGEQATQEEEAVLDRGGSSLSGHKRRWGEVDLCSCYVPFQAEYACNYPELSAGFLPAAPDWA